jgi:hypothetical protein
MNKATPGKGAKLGAYAFGLIMAAIAVVAVNALTDSSIVIDMLVGAVVAVVAGSLALVVTGNKVELT